MGTEGITDIKLLSESGFAKDSLEEIVL